MGSIVQKDSQGSQKEAKNPNKTELSMNFIFTFFVNHKPNYELDFGGFQEQIPGAMPEVVNGSGG
jgi:hypothetical protein